MWSNLRAAQAIGRIRYGVDDHRHTVVRVSDRIPDWVTSPIIHLSTARRTRAARRRQRRYIQAA